MLCNSYYSFNCCNNLILSILYCMILLFSQRKKAPSLVLMSVVSNNRLLEPTWNKMWAHSWHCFVLPTGMNGMWAYSREKALVLSLRSMVIGYVNQECNFLKHVSACITKFTCTSKSNAKSRTNLQQKPWPANWYSMKSGIKAQKLGAWGASKQSRRTTNSQRITRHWVI